MSDTNVSATGMPELSPEDRVDPFLSPRHGGTEVYLIRHADALPGADEVVQGDYNAQALSGLGRAQAAALAERMRELAPVAIYSSPIGRAVQTAAPIAETLGLNVEIDQGLREVELGPVGAENGSTASPEELSAALKARLHEIAAVALVGGHWSQIPGSESSEALRARATAAIDAMAARRPGQRIALVSHGGTINAYIAAFLGIDRDYFFPAANTSISIVRLRGARRLLLALNDVNHLQSAGLLMKSGM